MKVRTSIQPGVLENFRLFTGVRAGLLLLTILGELVTRGHPNSPISKLFILSVIDAGLLFLFLSARSLRRLLGPAYLPIGIVWASLGPILEPHLAFWLFANRLQEGALLVGAWQLIPILFIPLVVISWQYSFRQVILFCLLTALLDLAPFVVYPATLVGQVLVFPYALFGVVFIRTVSFLLVGNMISSMVKIQREQRRELTEANTRLARYATTLEQLTISRERNRLARELHDVLAHTLSEVAVELEAVRALWDGDPEKAQTMLAHSLNATREGLTETRRALQELRAMPLEDMGLGLAVRGLAESITSRSGLKLDLHIAEGLRDYPPEVQQAVYRVAQEALSNAVEHAGAGCVQVTLKEEDGRLKLVIADDGQGFNPSELSGEQQYGLRGMRERVEMIGGQFSVETQVGKGTHISLTYKGLI